ncbi:MAG: hypothetical protein QGH15_15420 [Kiritimatiellia bacterium]|jgi:hypothetical protein|nr:hypothetical protein [Kiritimatiellia bacterium]
MKKTCSTNVWTALYLAAFLGQSPALAARFEATGNTDETHRPAPHKQGEVVVTFDALPTRMSFDLPGHIKMYTENGIPYINGAAETYITSEGIHEGASYESWNDKDNKYSRMWIESQNEARIVVRHRCALIKGDKICHQEKRKVAPYGPGNWADEWYIFHPDGTYIRRVKIWSAVARESGRHGAAKYPYELEGMYLWWGAPCRGKMASDHLEDDMITLIKMDGAHKTIDLKPYPLEVKEYQGMMRAYGEFKDANIHVINTKSKYRPWRMGRWSRSLRITPYVPVHKLVQLVPCFPPDTTRDSGYSVAGLGQMNWDDFWEQTDDSMSEVWLNGWTNSENPVDELVAIARSWQEAPDMVSAAGIGIKLHGYDIGERAYLLEAASSQGARLKIAASSESPIVNPMFLVNGWGADRPKLTIDGKEFPKGGDFRFGHYKNLILQDGRKWENALAVWARINVTKETVFTINSARGGFRPAAEPAMFRTWTSQKGSNLEARLVDVFGATVTLETKTGKRVRINRSALSKPDQEYLDAK